MPAAAAAVELWDLQGAKLASGVTDRGGKFEITGPVEPGEYILLVDDASRVEARKIRLQEPDVEINLVLPAINDLVNIASHYTVSA
jgi:hypothetical protein